MAAAILLPVVMFSALALEQLRDGERDAALRGLHETARATALMVDREMASSVTALELLGRSPDLEMGDLQGFYKQAVLVNKRADSWTVLMDVDGRQLVSTRRPYGAELPPGESTLTSLMQEVMTTQKPRASDLVFDRAAQRWVTVLLVPVPVHGGRRYMLAQTFDVDYFNQAIFHSNIPRNWVVGVIGSDGRVIARNYLARELVGQPARADLIAAARERDQGLIRHRTLEDTDSYDAFLHSDIVGWTIAVAAPVDSIEATAGRAVALAALGLLLAIAFAVLAAALLGRRLVQAITGATEAAVALGHGEIPKLPASRVFEFDQLHGALAKAGVLLIDAQAARSQAEAERADLLQDEYLARLRAEDESLEKDQFLAMLGHELRNPLAAIRSAVAVSERCGHGTNEAAEARAVIGRQSGHLSRLVDDLLDASRMVGGKIQLSIQPVDLEKMAVLCLESLREAGREAGCQLRLTTGPAWVAGDPTRLEQVISNLLVNALKFTPPGGLVEVMVGISRDKAVLTVKDSGVGMSSELLPRIFDLFVQEPTSLDRAQGGLGIGLALVRQLVTLHGGTVSAASAGYGLGSIFTICLPLIPAPAALPSEDWSAGSPRRCWRILLIEDSDDARRMLSRLLVMEGHEVFEAPTAAAGLQLAALHQPDLAIVDIGLPDMSGYEVAQRLRSDDSGETMGLIALTGYGQEEDRLNALGCGFDFHLTKPADIKQLLALIDLCGETDLRRKTELAPREARAQPDFCV